MANRPGQTTEQRIAQIAQGFSQGLSPVQDAFKAQQAQEQNNFSMNLQLESQKRQRALEEKNQNLKAIELAASLSKETGRQYTPEMILPAIKSGDLSKFADTSKGLPFTPEFEAKRRKDEIDNQYKIARTNEINKNAGNPPKLDTVNEKQMEKLGTANAGLYNVRTAMQEALVKLNDPSISEDQKVKVGQGLFKLLNSAEGQDAVGAEEAKRLGSYLEFNLGNITQPGAFLGRDLPGFTEQISQYSDLLGNRILSNEKGINTLRSGGSLGSTVQSSANQRVAPISPSKLINNQIKNMTREEKLRFLNGN